MTSHEIRQSFLDFFTSKQHTIVPSASLLPDAPNLLFTNAGMNQFVPYFLGERTAPYPRAADTQKCIRAGGKHNDLEDVGLDTYHHTFFEMLGNWSFADYFKKESLEWSWELLTRVWKLPKERLYATVYAPSEGDPADFDAEAHAIWTEILEKDGLDPSVHLINSRECFWAMGDTGPCGPCSEIHIDLTEAGDTKGVLVDGDSPFCMELWNNVFIQQNAKPNGTFEPLAHKYVDTGMGFERVAGIFATTKNFTAYGDVPSNYNSDCFSTYFDQLTELCGHRYQRSLPNNPEAMSEVEAKDVAFRVIADHIRCLSCAIADGILPGNEGRNYVLRRILRRAVMYGKRLGLKPGFFASLVPVVVETLGPVFPEIEQQAEIIQKVIQSEEEAFSRTLERGLAKFDERDGKFLHFKNTLLGEPAYPEYHPNKKYMRDAEFMNGWRLSNESYANTIISALDSLNITSREEIQRVREKPNQPITFGEILVSLRDYPENQAYLDQLFLILEKTVSGSKAFELYDTYGFPIDLTQLLAKQQGLTVDLAGFEVEMEKQRSRARAAQKKSDILVTDTNSSEGATEFLGFDTLADEAKLIEVVEGKDEEAYLLFDRTPFYAEMGGQVGDTGTIEFDDRSFEVLDTIKDNQGRFLHKVTGKADGLVGEKANLLVNPARRKAIERHHSATHFLHWALRKVLGSHVRQAGSLVDADRLRFDFSHFEAIKPEQLAEIEELANERLLENSQVLWYETPFDEKPSDVIAFFGEKYGNVVRVVDIGGFSKELCGGTHVRSTGEIGLLRIVSESAIAAGTRRIEAVAGERAYRRLIEMETSLTDLSKRLTVPLAEVPRRVAALQSRVSDLESQLGRLQQQATASQAGDLVGAATEQNGLKLVNAIVEAENPNALRQVGAQILGQLGHGVVLLGAEIGGKASIVCLCSEAATKSGHRAGEIIRDLAARLGGKGGGKPDFAMGGAPDAKGLTAAIESFSL